MRRPTTSSTAILTFGIQVTGNSNSVRAFWMPLRKAGAERARHAGAGGGATVAGRAGKLHDGERAGDPRGQRPQARLWRAGGSGAAVRRRRRTVPLKDPKDFTLIGKPLKRLDTPDKVNGKVVYGIDAMLPGMKFATLAQCPGVRRQGRPGRRQRGQGRSRRAAGRRARRSGRGRRRSHVGGEEGPRCARHHLGRGPERERQLEGHLAGSARGEREGRASSQRPAATSPRAWRRASSSRRLTSCRFSPTRTMEPLNCTVHVKPDGCEIWTGTQVVARRAGGGGESRRPAGREGDRAQPSARRRLRPQARARHGGRRPFASPSRSTGR